MNIRERKELLHKQVNQASQKANEKKKKGLQDSCEKQKQLSRPGTR